MPVSLPVVYELSRETASGTYGSVVLAPYRLDSMGSMTATLTNLTNEFVGYGFTVVVFEFVSGEWVRAPAGDDYMMARPLVSIASGQVGYLSGFAVFRPGHAYRIWAEVSVDGNWLPDTPVAASFILLHP